MIQTYLYLAVNRVVVLRHRLRHLNLERWPVVQDPLHHLTAVGVGEEVPGVVDDVTAGGEDAHDLLADVVVHGDGADLEISFFINIK